MTPIVIDESPSAPEEGATTGPAVRSGVVTPKLAVPLRVAGGRLATVEQDSDDEIAACVYATVATPRGSRLEEPDYGVEDGEFEQLPFNTDEWVEQIGAWEPRAEVSTSEEIEEMLDKVTVRVKAR